MVWKDLWQYILSPWVRKFPFVWGAVEGNWNVGYVKEKKTLLDELLIKVVLWGPFWRAFSKKGILFGHHLQITKEKKRCEVAGPIIHKMFGCATKNWWTHVFICMWTHGVCPIESCSVFTKPFLIKGLSNGWEIKFLLPQLVKNAFSCLEDHLFNLVKMSRLDDVQQCFVWKY